MDHHTYPLSCTLTYDNALGRLPFDAQSNPSANIDEERDLQGGTRSAPSIQRAIDSVCVEMGAPSTSRTQRQPPILDLPIELFLGIIHFALEGGDRSSVYYGQLTLLCLVCTQWARTIQSSSEFWVKLYGQMNQNLLETVILRSGELPLDVIWNSGNAHTARVFAQHASRWRSLNVKINNSTNGSRNVAFLPSAAYTSNPPDILFANGAPNLKSVSVWDAVIPWSSLALSNLSELTLDTIAQDAPTFESLLDILAASPGLQRLQITRTRMRLLSDTSSRIVNLPDLSSLKLEYLHPKLATSILLAVEVPPVAACTFGMIVGAPLDDAFIKTELSIVTDRLVTLHRMIENDTGGTLSLSMGHATEDEPTEGNWEVTLRYEPGDKNLGWLAIALNAPPDLHLYILSKLARGNQPFGSSILTTLRPIHPHLPDESVLLSNGTNMLSILAEILPNVQGIELVNLNEGELATVMRYLFPYPAEPGPIPKLTRLITLTIQGKRVIHDNWIMSLYKRRKQGPDSIAPLPSALKVHFDGGVVNPLGRGLLAELLQANSVSFGDMEYLMVPEWTPQFILWQQ